MPRIRCRIAILAIVLALQGRTPQAADPEPYTVTIAKTPDSALNAALSGSSDLESLRTTAPAGPFALVERARRDQDRFVTALQSFGYFKGRVAITINGHPLNDPSLVGLLQQAPASPPAKVDVAVMPGPQFHIGRVNVTGVVPPQAQATLNLHPGQPAVASDVLAAQGRLLNALREEGYALAKVDLQPAVVHLNENVMDVAIKVATGPRVDIGPITFQGLDGVNASFIRRRAQLHQGELFSPTKIESARADLAGLPIFSYVHAQPATALDAQGQLPMTIYFGERPLHAVDFGASYSTDLGVGLTAGWHDRNLFGNAEQLNLTAAFQGGGNSQLHPGYKVNAQFLKPDYFARNQTLEVNVGAVDQSLLAYSQKALLQSVTLTRQLAPHWNFSYGVGGEEERIGQEGVFRNYTLLLVPLALRFDDTNSLLNPTRGIRAALTVTPVGSLTGTRSAFLITQLSGSTYLDLSGNGRTVLAMRGLIGNAFGASEFSLPPDMRFYAGGSGTVRGYKFQSVGPQFPDGTPIGGTEITAGSIELRQRVLQNWGFTLFTDAGQVSARGTAFTEKYGVGVGAGVLYYTSIGPMRAQFAIPAVTLPNSGSYELYIGIGQAF
jgi:translocation and assembly module TamA